MKIYAIILSAILLIGGNGANGTITDPISASELSLTYDKQANAAEVTPDQLEFRRQAVRRMIFDRSQDIQLSGLWPSKIVGLDVMHPPVGPQANSPQLAIVEGRLRIIAKKACRCNPMDRRVQSFCGL